MNLEFSLSEEVPSSLPKGLFSEILRETLEVAGWKTASGFPVSTKKVTLNAVAVSEKRIRELNKRYRGIDEATDVLSFGEESVATQNPDVFLGELFFSPQFIRRQAKIDKGPYRQAMIYIFSHGILHLLGYDHGKKMFAYQDTVTEKLFLAFRQGKKSVKENQTIKEYETSGS